MKHFLLALFVCSAAAYAADTPVRAAAPVHAKVPVRAAAAARAKARAKHAGSATAVAGAPYVTRAAPVISATVSQCFKVVRLLKSDAAHYWADWANTCPYTIDAVYVMVGFLDSGHNEMGNGVWPMYFIQPGVHRVTRFSAPLEGFETVRVHRITSDSAVALADPASDLGKTLIWARTPAGQGSYSTQNDRGAAGCASARANRRHRHGPGDLLRPPDRQRHYRKFTIYTLNF